MSKTELISNAPRRKFCNTECREEYREARIIGLAPTLFKPWCCPQCGKKVREPIKKKIAAFFPLFDVGGGF